MAPATTDQRSAGRAFMRHVVGEIVVVGCLAGVLRFAWWLTPRWDLLREADQTFAVLTFVAFAVAAGLAWEWSRR